MAERGRAIGIFLERLLGLSKSLPLPGQLMPAAAEASSEGVRRPREGCSEWI
jgi:hypothetical protein